MATRLEVFNEALRIIGEQTITDPDVATKVGRALRAAFRPASKKCLETGMWNFGQKRAPLARSSTNPAFGYAYAFQKPGDVAKIVRLHDGPSEDAPLRRYSDETGKILADAESVYLRWVSNDWIEDRIGDWSQAYADFVSSDLAFRVCEELTSKSPYEKGIDKTRLKNMREALAFDAMSNPQAMRQQGSWAARRSHRGRAERA